MPALFIGNNNMSAKSNDQGRAYEYACLNVLHEEICKIRNAQIKKNSSYYAAASAWETLSSLDKSLYALSAKSAVPTIFAMEPNIVEVADDTLLLYIQNDKHGENADVRDIIIERSDIVWEIGFSIKHNHMAVKHSRLAKDLDFGEKWYGMPCSAQYWSEVQPVFDFLQKEKDRGMYFRNLRSKEDDVYVPLLKAFMREVDIQTTKDKTIPQKLVAYLLSKYDFYKVISIDSQRLTTIQSFNMYGSLNLPSRTTKPKIIIPIIKLPTALLHMGFKPKSKTTIILCFDNGWQFSFRIHNAEDAVNTSLKFDIQIVGMPAEINMKYNCKW